MEEFKFKPRSLIKIHSSFLLSLPLDWINNNKLKKGDLIDIRLDSIGRLILKKKRK